MTVTDNYCHELPQNYPVANNVVWRKNALDFLDPIVKGVTTAGAAVLAAPLGLGVGSMATGAAGAGAGYVAGDNLMDFAREVAGVPREKGSLPQELLYQTKNMAEGALTEIGGVALTKGLHQISKAIGDSKFATAWTTSPYFRKAMTKLANEPKQINNPLIQQVVGKVSGKNAVESLKRAETYGIENDSRLVAKEIAEANGWHQPKDIGRLIKETLQRMYPRGEAALVGNFPQKVSDFLINKNIQLANPMVVLTDKRIIHMKRTAKVARGQDASENEIIQLPEKLTDKSTRWFYDNNFDNVIFAFVREGDIYVKFPVYLNRNIRGKIGNELATGGKVDKNSFKSQHLIEIK